MIPGAPIESRWFRTRPHREPPRRLLEKVVAEVFPSRRVMDVQLLADGLRNANFRLQLNSTPTFVVLRIYEHHPSLCQKEIDLLNLIKGCIPVPEVIHAEPNGLDEIPPFLLVGYVEGVTFHELKRRGDVAAISQAAYSVGQTLASIGRITLPKPGWLGPGPQVGAPLLEGANAGLRFVDLCLESANVQQRMETGLVDQTHALVWSYAAELARLDGESCLVHGDFGNRNLLVQQVAGNWSVAAVLDWEFAVSGSPLSDVGHFLRYECAAHPVVEPYFSQGYGQAGGRLPNDWRRLARVMDLIALCDSLTHDELPSDVVAELLELVRATVENRDPQFN